MQVSWDTPTRVAAILTLRSVQQGSILEMRLRKEGLALLDFTKEEQEKVGLQVLPTGNVQWDSVKGLEKFDLMITEGVKSLICARLDQLSSQKGFSTDLLPLAEYFNLEPVSQAEKDEEVAAEAVDPATKPAVKPEEPKA